MLLVSGVLVARILGVEDRGHLALLALIPSILVQVGSFGLPLAATFEISRERTSAAAVVATLTRPAALQCVVLTGVHGLILYFLLQHDDAYVVTAGLITLALVPAQLANQYGLALLQGLHQYRLFNVARLMPNVSYAVVLVALFFVPDASLVVVMITWVVGYLASGLLSCAVAVKRARRLRGGTSPSLAALTRFGVRGFLGSTTPLDSFRVDQAIVGLLLSPAALGLYVVGIAFTNLPRFVAQSAGMVAYPHIASIRDPVRARREMWRYFALVVPACLAICGLLAAVVGWFIPLFFGEAFAGAASITRIMLIGVVFLCARRVLADCSRGAGFPTHGTLAEVSAWITVVPALVLFVPSMQEDGVALAMSVAAVVSFVVLLCAVLLSERRVRRIPDEPPALVETTLTGG